MALRHLARDYLQSLAFPGLCETASVDTAAKSHDLTSMPFYEYELCRGNCSACGGRFTLRRPLSAPELKKCPACKKPVRKVFSKFSSPQKLKPVSISDAKAAGFTVLKRVNKGEYEKQ
jgi:putative FmdB family regulatory protein